MIEARASGTATDRFSSLDRRVEKTNSLPEEYTLAEILSAVSRVSGFLPAEISGPRRRERVVMARFVFYHLAKRFTTKSSTVISMFLGGRDHATVLNGWNRVEANPEKYQIMANAAIDCLRTRSGRELL